MGLIAAAVTIVLRRALPAAREVLLVHRNPELPVQGGVWAFPGGRIDAVDVRPGADLLTERSCAVRELAEETGLRSNPAALRPVARWVTPQQVYPRFDTWIFSNETSDGEVRVDGREIVGHAWWTAEEALQTHQRRELRLSPPAFVMLSLLAAADDLEKIWPPGETLLFSPRLVRRHEGDCSLYEGDAGYRDGNLERPGERHRLWMGPGAWRYERRLKLCAPSCCGDLS